jgi:hypothetical protein
MHKGILFTLTTLVMAAVTCLGGGYASTRGTMESVERSRRIDNIQITQAQSLPPYGVRVSAETARLDVEIGSEEKNGSRAEALRNAIDYIAERAADSEAITFESVNSHQVGGSYGRDVLPSSENVYSLDTSAVTVRLSTPLKQTESALIDGILAFNAFLDTLELPDTIEVTATSVTADIGDTNAYRRQLIDAVYQELTSMQEVYGSDVKIEIAGLYEPLSVMQLSDTEYYLYLKPVINITEF